MRLRGIDFGHVMNASGARNFFGQGYWFHHWLRPFGLSFDNSTFVAKTTSFDPREGNMVTRGDDGMTPKELFPDCIMVDYLKQTVLNAVGLTSPGIKALLTYGYWQRIQHPFFISFAALGDSIELRLGEYKAFVAFIKPHLRHFKAPVGLEINLVCPNKEYVSIPTVEEIGEALNILSALHIPLVAKMNILMSYEACLGVQKHRACDAICMSNTIPWDALPHFIDRNVWFGTTTSPLKKYGGGGFSGAPLYSLVTGWICEARRIGFHKPIIGCGGIMRWQDACGMFNAGADAIQIGSVSILRPSRIKHIIRHANGPPHTEVALSR